MLLEGELEGYEDGLELPYDFPRTSNRAWRAATFQHSYPPALARKVAELSREQQSTLFMSLVASLAVVLNRYTGRQDLCIGTTVAGRAQVGALGDLSGSTVDILPLRLDLSGAPSLHEVLRRTKAVVLEGFEHEALPCQIPLVPVVVRHQNFPMARLEGWSEGVELKKFELAGERTTASEQDWQFFGDGSSLELSLEYAAELFSEKTVRRMVEHHQRVLEALVEGLEEGLHEVRLLTEEEEGLHGRLNDTARELEERWSLAETFERQVRETPEAVACVGVEVATGGHSRPTYRQLTYRQLNARANQVARRLRALGVGAETRVAVLSDRSPELLVAMLAIFKAGGCYVPVDPQYPGHYIEQILEDAAPQVVLGKRGRADGVRVDVWLELDGAQRLTDEALAAQEEGELEGAERPESQQLACLMYTSGSTGRPKGVMVPYSQLHNWLEAGKERSPLERGEVMLQKTAIAFAVSVKELLSGLLAGVAQVMVPETLVKDSVALAEEIERWRVTRIHLVPSHLGALLEGAGEEAKGLRSLKYVITAGEALAQGVREEARRKLPGAQLWNNYGCTELNDVTYHPASEGGGDTVFVPIGRPIANTRVYVLDEQLRRVPVGVMGELYVDSVGMARGYWGQPALTAERFIANPYASQPGARLYRTGDMVRVLADGSLEYLGRRDYEIKVRGHRVDVRQVEKVANAHPAIRQAVVSGWPLGSSNAQLVAYLVPQAGATVGPRQVRDYLAESLPAYMVPTLYTVLEELPRLPNGKLDRLSLPEPDLSSSREEYVAPHGEVERKLAEIFGNLLGLEHVGVHDNFFSLGGHSLLASQLISRIRATFRVEVAMATVFESPTVEPLARHIEEKLKDESRVQLSNVVPVERTQEIPLSYLQERLWFVHEHMKEQRTSYNITWTLHFAGKGFSVEALRMAFDELVARHETLRTWFQVGEGTEQAVQVIGEPWSMELPLREVAGTEVTAAINEMSRQVFDLRAGRLLTAAVLRVAEDEHILVSNIHHIITDGWSFGVMLQELRELYEAAVRGERAELPPLTVQYGDYAVWQRKQDLSEHLAYWKGKVEGYEDGLELPYDFPRTSNRAWRAATFQYSYPPELARKVAELSREQQSTLFMSLVASLAVVLNRYTGREDLCIGTTVAGRAQVELESLIGFFINILPLRLDLSGAPSLHEVLRRTKVVVLEGFEHQELPFEHLLKALRRQRDSSQIPLVPVVVRHQNFPMARLEGWSEGVELKKFELAGERTTASEQDWQFFGDGSSLELSLEYAAELFSEKTVRRMVEHHQRVLEALVEGLEEGLHEVRLLTEEEEGLHGRLNDTARELEERWSLAETFERQVRETPEAVACVGVEVATGGHSRPTYRQLTYRQLNARANQVARRLRALGVGAETRVAVLSDRSPELLVAMLAIFKAGGCYVPVDPQYPGSYIEQILEDAAPQVVLGKRGRADGVRVDVWLELDGAQRLTDEALAAQEEGELEGAERPESQQLACLMYTSGSTGRPKGVMVPYSQLHNWLEAGKERSPLERGEVMLQKTAIAFAVSVKELLSGLLAGVAQVMVPETLVKDSVALAQEIERWRVTRIHLVPSHLGALLEGAGEEAKGLRSLKYVITAGEALAQGVREEARRKLPGAQLWNNYGCTELNDVTYHPASEGGGDTVFVPIGRPIANTRVYVLDEQLRRVPVGVMGELYVDSVGMARGYWGQPALTAERFIANPYASQPGARLYRTGDMVRVLADGSLEYLGRRDYEIKVRGHRVDVRQVEKVANAHPAIRQAVVSGWPLGSSNAQLVAYLVPQAGATVGPRQVRDYLAESLPAYMVPTLYTVLEELPRLPNGKLDRLSLPEPDLSSSREEYVAPHGEVERKLAEIFGNLLGLEHVGVHDNFFSLGGHSLLAAQVVSRIGKELGTQISIADLFQRPTIEQLCELIGGLDDQTQRELALAPSGNTEAVLSFAQERMWFLHNFVKGMPYNTPGLDHLTGELDVAALEKAIRAVIRRHEPLRTNFVEKDGVLSQLVGTEERFRLTVTPIRDESEVARLMEAVIQTPVDLERELMIRAYLYRVDPRNHYLFTTIHHIAFDGWSTSIFYRELAAYYAAFLRREDSPLPALEISYQDYARWERAHFQDEVLAEKLRYWRQRLSGARPLVLPTTYHRPPIQSFAGAVVNFEIDRSITERLKTLFAESGTTMYMVLLGAFSVVLQRYSGQDDICIGSPVANRGHIQTEGLIGLFVNTLVMRVDAAGNPRFIDLLARIQRTAIDAYANQEVPFEKIVDDLQVARDTARSPLVQVILNFHNTPPQSELELQGVTLTRMPVHNGTAKFELSIDVAETSAGLTGFVEYATDLFSENFIRRMIGHLEVVLDAVGRDPRAPIHELPLLTRQEQLDLLSRSGHTAPAVEHVELIPHTFERRVQESPQAIALVCGDERVTYSALNRRASQIARRLRAAGIGPDTLVGLCAGRSIELVCGVLGILKAGGAYVPIDPTSSPEVIYDVLYESKVRHLLTESRLVGGLPVDDQEILLLDTPADGEGDKAVADREEPPDLGEVSLTPECLAYVNFTSDSGGAPRGIAVRHGALARRMAAGHAQYLANSAVRFLLKAPLTFDLAVAELFQWIVSGGSLSILDPNADRDASAFLAQVRRDSIGVLYCVPSELSTLVSHLERERERVHELNTLRFIFCGGDTLAVTVVERLGVLVRAGQLPLRLVNVYGTKETGIGAGCFECALDANDPSAELPPGRLSHERMPIGGPAQNLWFYVVQPNGGLAPLGIPGELYVGGAQLADARFGDEPTATHPGFVPNPFRSGAEKDWLYKTGDLVRWLPQGPLELVSAARERDGGGDHRLDRGFIEARMRRVAIVRDAVVAYVPDRQDRARLVAYVVLKESPAADVEPREGRETLKARISAELGSTLPEYMLPAAYVFMDSLPLTAYGRIDRKALPEPEDDRHGGSAIAYVAPRGPTEKALAHIWQQVLKRPQVGLRDNFFELGGHSVAAIQLVSVSRKHLEVEVPLSLIFESPVLEAMARGIEALQQQGRSGAVSSIHRVERTGPLPLAYVQERLWFVHEHMKEQRTSYNITWTLHFAGKGFSVEALRTAFDELVARHETLRTWFQVGEGTEQAVQVIGEPWSMELPLREVAGTEVTAAINEMSRQVFDLRAGRLLTAAVLRVAEDEHILVSNIHHIITDGWSFGVMLRELRELYEAAVRGERAELPPLTVQYGDYAVWQRKQDLSEHLAYWKGKVEGDEDGLELPYDFPRTSNRAWRAATFQYSYPPALARKVAELSREQQSTLFMSLVASLAVVLNRYTGREDLCIGTTVAGRAQVELESLIGFFINILPLRLDLSGAPSLHEVLRRTKVVVLEGFEHQELPFEHLLKALRRQRDSSQIPLVPVVVRHQNFPMARLEGWSEGVELKKFELAGERTTASEQDWQFFGDGSSLELSLEYAAELFSEKTVRRMVEHHQRVLEALVEGLEEGLHEVRLLTEEEEGLHGRLNDTARELEERWSLAETFERQVRETPEAVACVGVEVATGGHSRPAYRQLTYRQLNARANQVARRLRALGVGAETRVAVLSDRSPELLVAMLAIFKAGGCYVPVDPQYPGSYIEQILEDAAPQVVLGKRGRADGVRVDVWLELDGAQRLTDEALAAQEEGELEGAERPESQQLACLMYTSGSTGRPKGVMVPYSQLHNWLEAGKERSPLERGEVMLQKTAIAFAVSVKELLSGLLAGVAQVMVPETLVKDSVALAEEIERWRVTRIHLVPSHLGALLEGAGEEAKGLRSLKYVITAGEALAQGVREEARRKLPGAQLWNNYGCTELNDVTYHPASEGGGDTVFVPIGRPIANTRVYVLDEQLRRVPVGVMGELYVDSVGMARGYWGQPALTAERFIANPYASQPGARLYRTGDMVRVLADGSLEYLGRRDYEIKVRGHRVDVRQVEKVANAHPAIRQAVVSGWPLGSSNAQLVAYLVPQAGATVGPWQVRDYLAESLPAYMVPTLYTVLEELPRLPNGKLDRLSLPEPDLSSSREEYVAPHGEVERKLAEIFGNLLGLEHVGVHDNFFNLGGHSLLASQLISRIRATFRVEVAMATVFESPTVEPLARHIEEKLKDESRVQLSNVVPVERTQELPLSYLQERLWFVHEHMKEQRTSYNGTIGLRLRGPLSIPALRATFHDLVARHESLRTVFRVPEGRTTPVQVILDSMELDIPVRDATEADIIPGMDELAGHIYDMEKGPLFMVRLLRLAEDSHVLLMGMHHIVYDAWSQFNVMSRDINLLYSAHVTGIEARLPALPIQYADFSVWQRQQDFRHHLDYWKSTLGDYRDDLELPYDYPRPPSRTWHATRFTFRYPDALARAFARFNQSHQSTLFMGLLTSFAIVLRHYTGRNDICIGTTTAGRAQLELENLVGFFINILPLRINLAGDPDISELMNRAKKSVLGAFEHQALPFERLLSALNKQRDSSHIPLVPVMLRHQNFPTAMTGKWADGVDMEVIERDERTTPNELDLQFFGDDTYLHAVVEFPAQLFSEVTVRRLMQRHQKVIEFMCATLGAR
nr:CysK [synthetic construct]